jgi:hypothetical protein
MTRPIEHQNEPRTSASRGIFGEDITGRDGSDADQRNELMAVIAFKSPPPRRLDIWGI